jgi:hypothetical protein
MPVMLADVGGLFAIAFLLISFIGWVMNLINSQNPPPAPNRGPQRRPQARDKKVQSEIEEFLQEALGNKKRPRATDVRTDEIESVESALRQPQKRGPSTQLKRRGPSPRSGSPQQIPPAGESQERRKPGSGVASRHVIASSDLGRNVSSHVQEHMSRRVRNEAEQHLPHAVDHSVANHLGEFTADDRDPRSTVKPVFRPYTDIPDPESLIAQLKSPAGMRKAIILQEILAKPRILRK